MPVTHLQIVVYMFVGVFFLMLGLHILSIGLGLTSKMIAVLVSLF